MSLVNNCHVAVGDAPSIFSWFLYAVLTTTLIKNLSILSAFSQEKFKFFKVCSSGESHINIGSVSELPPSQRCDKPNWQSAIGLFAVTTASLMLLPVVTKKKVSVIPAVDIILFLPLNVTRLLF